MPVMTVATTPMDSLIAAARVIDERFKTHCWPPWHDSTTRRPPPHSDQTRGTTHMEDMPHHIDSLTVATDGASSGAQGPSGWAYVTEHGDWKAGSLAKSTNQVGELLGIHHAVVDHMHVEHLTIESDSAYAIGTYTQWMDAHARRGWKTADGKPTSNKSIIWDLRRARDKRRTLGLPDVRLVKVKGHAPKGTHPLNEAADERAVWVKKTYAFDGVEATLSGHTDDAGIPVTSTPHTTSSPTPDGAPAASTIEVECTTLRKRRPVQATIDNLQVSASAALTAANALRSYLAIKDAAQHTSTGAVEDSIIETRRRQILAAIETLLATPGP